MADSHEGQEKVSISASLAKTEKGTIVALLKKYNYKQGDDRITVISPEFEDTTTALQWVWDRLPKSNAEFCTTVAVEWNQYLPPE